MVRAVVLYCSDDFLRGVVICALDDRAYHVDYLCGCASALLVVLDYALSFNQQNAEGYYERRVWYRVPGEGEAQDVYQNAEYYDAQVVQDLRYGSAQDPALDSFFVFTGCVDSRPEVYQAGGYYQNAAYKNEGYAVADVLREGQM